MRFAIENGEKLEARLTFKLKVAGNPIIRTKVKKRQRKTAKVKLF